MNRNFAVSFSCECVRASRVSGCVCVWFACTQKWFDSDIFYAYLNLAVFHAAVVAAVLFISFLTVKCAESMAKYCCSNTMGKNMKIAKAHCWLRISASHEYFAFEWAHFRKGNRVSSYFSLFDAILFIFFLLAVVLRFVSWAVIWKRQRLAVCTCAFIWAWCSWSLLLVLFKNYFAFMRMTFVRSATRFAANVFFTGIRKNYEYATRREMLRRVEAKAEETTCCDKWLFAVHTFGIG